MSILYQPQYRVHGTVTWSNWGSPIATTSTIVGANPPGPSLTPSTQYDFQVVASNSFGSTPSAVVMSTTAAGTSITGITLSNQSFVAGGTQGTIVGAVNVTLSSGTFSGSLTVTGTDAAIFQSPITGGNLTLSGASTTARTYNINIVAAQTGLASFTQNFPSITAAAASQESAEGFIVNTVGPIVFSSQNAGFASPSGPWDQFALVNVGAGRDPQISLNGSTAGSQANTGLVAELIYHNHTTFQENTSLGWWRWDTTGVAWVEYGVSSVALSGNAYAANAPVNTLIGTISVTMKDGNAFNGVLSVDDITHFKIVGNQLQAATTLSATSYPITITAVPAVSGANKIGEQGTLPQTIAQTGTNTLIQIPSGIHTGAGLGGNNTPYSSPLVHYNAFNGTGSGTGGGLGLTAQGRHTTVLATCLGGGTVEFGGASPDGWPNYTDAARWVSTGFPTDGSVSPMIHWAFSDSSTNTNFALYSNAQIRSNTTYPGSSSQTIEHWIRTTLSQWTSNIPNLRTLYIRPMWEWNIGGPGANYDVGSAGNMPAFVEAFRGFANVCHDWGNSQNPRIAVKLLWSASVFNGITGNSYGLPVIQQFPAPDGNARPASDGVTQRYIDVMGPDFYWDTNADPRVGFDGLPTNGTFSRTTNQRWTMNALVDLALFYNIPIAISETGFINGFTTMYQNFFPNIVVPWLNSMNTSSYRSVGGLAGPMRWEFACWFDLTLGNAYCFSNPAGGDINMVGQAFGSLLPTTFGSCAKAMTVA